MSGIRTRYKGERGLKPLDFLEVSTHKGRITDTLTRGIAAERQPSIFDTPEIIERDRDLQELLRFDEALGIDRKGKPVYLSDIQTRIVFALSYGISQELESEDISMKIKQSLRGGNKIKRLVNIYSLSSLIYNSTRKRYREQIVTALFKLSKIRQIICFETADKRVKITSPLIMIGDTIEIESLTKDERENIDSLELYFGAAFFHRLDNRFSFFFTPKLFEVWRKGGRQTELFRILLASLHNAYSHYKIAANKAEQRVKEENKALHQSSEKLLEAITEARRIAMTYELNISSIKQRVTTDYDSERSYKTKFNRDLQNAIEGFKELGLIEEASIQRGARGQDKVAFILSETYATAEQKVKEIPLLNAPDEEEQISAF